MVLEWMQQSSNHTKSSRGWLTPHLAGGVGSRCSMMEEANRFDAHHPGTRRQLRLVVGRLSIGQVLDEAWVVSAAKVDLNSDDFVSINLLPLNDLATGFSQSCSFLHLRRCNHHSKSLDSFTAPKDRSACISSDDKAVSR